VRSGLLGADLEVADLDGGAGGAAGEDDLHGEGGPGAVGLVGDLDPEPAGVGEDGPDGVEGHPAAAGHLEQAHLEQGAGPAGPDQEGGGVDSAWDAAEQPGQGDALVAGTAGGEAARPPPGPGRLGALDPGPPRASQPADGGSAAGWPAPPGLVTGGPLAGDVPTGGPVAAGAALGPGAPGRSGRPTIWAIRTTIVSTIATAASSHSAT
jgi:hypothetical protein